MVFSGPQPRVEDVSLSGAMARLGGSLYHRPERRAHLTGEMVSQADGSAGKLVGKQVQISIKFKKL